MRSARLQAQDLNRTNQFVNALLSKDDIKDLERPDLPEPAKPPPPQPMVNGGGIQFRVDGKSRFSDPPAPPPQQPLPEKPDVPSLRRGTLDRPKSGPPNSSPVRQENLAQIIQLTEALNNAKRDMDTQTARMRELEVMLQREREARELAEDLARRLEENTKLQMNGAAKTGAPETSDVPSEPTQEGGTGEPAAAGDDAADAAQEGSARADAAQKTATALQSRIDNMDGQMREMREQLEAWKRRCETAESERDQDRKTLADMVVRLRAEQAKVADAEQMDRSRSRRARGEMDGAINGGVSAEASRAQQVDAAADEAGDMNGDMTLSRANTLTPQTWQRRGLTLEHQLHAGLPYASMLGVVLIGMGLMTYMNGWQTPPPRLER